MYQFTYHTPIGKICIAEDDGLITHISYKQLNFAIKETPLIKKTYNELNEYFAGTRKIFDIPIKLNGTPFQIKVWEALKNITYGKTASYKDIAKTIGNEKACRAVGMANNKNPIIIIIPCHRIIGSNGNLTGYAGGLAIKNKLLELEKSIYKNKTIKAFSPKVF